MHFNPYLFCQSPFYLFTQQQQSQIRMRQISSCIRTLQHRPAFRSSTHYTPQQLEKAQKYVQETLRSRSWSSYILLSYLPKEIKADFAAIQMFDMEISKVAEAAKEVPLAMGRLDFWRSAIARIYCNQKPNAQPVSIALHHACHNNPLTKGYFMRMIDVKADEITHRTIDTMLDMRKMADNSKSTMIALTLQLLRIEIDNDPMRQVVSNLGQSMGICQYLKRVPYSLRNNRFLLPQQLLTKHNLTVRKLWDRQYGKPHDDLFDVVLEIAAYSKKSFDIAVKVYKDCPNSFPPHSFRAFLGGVQNQMYLQNLQKYNFNLFDSNMNKAYPIKLPYRIYHAAKAKNFFVGMKLKD